MIGHDWSWLVMIGHKKRHFLSKGNNRMSVFLPTPISTLWSVLKHEAASTAVNAATTMRSAMRNVIFDKVKKHEYQRTRKCKQQNNQ